MIPILPDVTEWHVHKRHIYISFLDFCCEFYWWEASHYTYGKIIFFESKINLIQSELKYAFYLGWP